MVNVSSPRYHYDVVHGVDVEGMDLGFVKRHDVDTMKRMCDATATCAGFNTNGWLKKSVFPRAPSDASLYIKTQLTHHTVFVGQSSNGGGQHHVGDRQHHNPILSWQKQLAGALDWGRLEKRFKVFVYPIPLDLQLPHIKDYKYGLESVFTSCLQHSPHITHDPREATAFMIPVQCAESRFTVTDRQQGQEAADNMATTMFQRAVYEFPYFNTSHGADHFIVCGHDMGAAPRTAAATALGGVNGVRNVIAVVNTADATDPNYHIHKDISAPPHVGDGCPHCIQGGHPITPHINNNINNSNNINNYKEWLGFFAGNMGRGRIRPLVLSAFHNTQSMLIVDGYMAPEEYISALLSSEYCLFLRGFRAWSPRLMDAVWAGCIPVILSDGYVLPLSRWVDWSLAAVVVAEKDYTMLETILKDDEPLRPHRRQYLTHAQHILTWGVEHGDDGDAERCSGAFEHIMYELQLRLQ